MAHNTRSMVCLDDFEEDARKKLSRGILGYIEGGAGNETTLRDNINAFNRLLIIPRTLRDVSSRNTETTILGGRHRLSFPVGIAPMAMHRLVHPDGELATARAAAAMGTVMVQSTLSTVSIEDVSNATRNSPRGEFTSALFFQLYMNPDRQVSRQLVQRAERSGYSAIVLTVDVPLLGNRRAHVRNGFALPPHLSLANYTSTNSTLGNIGETAIDAALTWNDVTWLKSMTSLPIILKGILAVEDAVEAASRGVAAVWVSNHGGRQLDTVPAAIDVLGEIVKAVDGRCEVYLDGGVRTGTDVFKSLALGARAVFIGRPALYGLACDGESGVRHVLEILRDEFSSTMALAGCCQVSEINSSFIRRTEYHQQQQQQETKSKL